MSLASTSRISAITLGMALLAWGGGVGAVEALLTELVQARGGDGSLTLDGTVEARQDTRVAAQVSGRITRVNAKAGDLVQAGQALLQIDATLAGQQLAASQAQLAQAEAMLRAAQAEYARAQTLLAKGYISPAGMDQARAQFQSAQAGADALLAQARATGTQAGFHVVKAPYAGRVTQVSVSEGDLATPGAPLLQLFSPQGLRVAVSVPESDVARLDLSGAARISLPHAGDQVWSVSSFTLLPGLDPVTHAATLRVDLPAAAASAAAALGPGQLARVSLPLKAVSSASSSATGPANVSVQASSVVQRGEVPAVYVVDAQGVPRLRQVRLGRSNADRVDVVAGLKAGERVATEPLKAARLLP
jgi:multidrug efflux system membrane fusion protein